MRTTNTIYTANEQILEMLQKINPSMAETAKTIDIDEDQYLQFVDRDGLNFCLLHVYKTFKSQTYFIREYDLMLFANHDDRKLVHRKLVYNDMGQNDYKKFMNYKTQNLK